MRDQFDQRKELVVLFVVTVLYFNSQAKSREKELITKYKLS